MEVGFIGAGAIASAVAGHLVSAGHPVTLSDRRGPGSLKDQVAALGPPARVGARAEAAAAPLVFLFRHVERHRRSPRRPAGLGRPDPGRHHQPA